VTLHSITVLGRDRPGIIAETTGRLADLGLNIEDTTMTLLRGHFAMMLVCAGSATDAEIETALAPLTEDGSLTVSVRVVPDEDVSGSPAVGGTSWVLTVHGGDRPGIVSSVVAEVARVGGNITDLTTRLAGDLYLLVAELDLPEGVDPAAVDEALREAAASLGVVVTLRPAETDDL
jgi:glycine cleavage system transcriptional repressor